MKRPQLFLLHFAGGNCYSFQFMYSFLTNFDIVPLELPGRGNRIKEKLLTDFDEAANDVYNQIRDKRNSNRALIYGHSLGAYLALRVSSMLEKTSIPLDYLVVSGNAGPGIKAETTKYLLEEEHFKEALKLMGGIPPAFFEQKELLDFFMPIFRADFEVAEKNELTTEAPINIPIFAMMGSQEKEVEKISNWAKYTRAYFNYEIIGGGHFFINDHPQKVASVITNCYNQLLPFQQQMQK